jgi:hypothetical protein
MGVILRAFGPVSKALADEFALVRLDLGRVFGVQDPVGDVDQIRERRGVLLVHPEERADAVDEVAPGRAVVHARDILQKGCVRLSVKP